MVARALEYIAAGDIYQVNLANRLRLVGIGDPLAAYVAAPGQPGPLCGIPSLGQQAIASLSPELFLRLRVGEEYYILVQLKTLQYMTREIREIYNVDLEDLKDILETIIRDEEIHRELLSKMKKILLREEKQTEDIAPAVRYTNLGSWSRSMPNSICEKAH